MRRNNKNNNNNNNTNNTKNSGNKKNNNNNQQKMEQSFYDDNNSQFTNSTSNSSTNSNNNNMKRPLSLDLNTKSTPAKKQRLNQAANNNPPTPLVLESPDLQSLKFNTPDIEKFILANTGLTPTPTQNLVFPTKVTSEQEDYAKGFEDALNSLRNSENSQSLSMNTSTSIVNGMSGGSITYTNLDEIPVATIKDEPQTVPNSPPLSPIDMEDQERIKLERKRQRNRVAASKCRKRKLERISKLEDKVKSLKGENAELATLIKRLKEHVCLLKQQVMDHVHAGCTLISVSTMK